MIITNFFDLGLSDDLMQIIFAIIALVLTILIAKMFDILHYEVIMILFVFIVTLLYAFDLASITLLIISYLILGVWFYILFNSNKSEGVPTQ